MNCIYFQCSNLACYNFPGIKIALFCNFHKTDKMIFKIDKQCSQNSCFKTPTYGYIHNDFPTHCSEHKISGMIVCSYSKCRYKNCDKYPFYGYEGLRMYCNYHKYEDMEFNYNRKCKKCNNDAFYNFSYSKKPIYCKKHKLQKMKNIYINNLLDNLIIEELTELPDYCFQISNNSNRKRKNFLTRETSYDDFSSTCEKYKDYETNIFDFFDYTIFCTDELL